MWWYMEVVMADMGELYRDWAEHKRRSKAARLEKAEQLEGWTKFTPYHWSTTIHGKQLDWWPTTGRWRYNGRTQAGTQEHLLRFIARRITGKKGAFDERDKRKLPKTPDEDGWIRHTKYHWSRTVGGARLDYWPSGGAWRYDNGPIQYDCKDAMFDLIKGQ
jgi:hypothetical protein